MRAYEALRDATLLMQLTAQGEADVQAGRTVPQSDVFDRVRRRRTRERAALNLRNHTE